MVIFNVGGARSGRDLYRQLADTIGRSDRHVVRAISEARRPGSPKFVIMSNIDAPTRLLEFALWVSSFPIQAGRRSAEADFRAQK